MDLGIRVFVPLGLSTVLNSLLTGNRDNMNQGMQGYCNKSKPSAVLDCDEACIAANTLRSQGLVHVTITTVQ